LTFVFNLVFKALWAASLHERCYTNNVLLLFKLNRRREEEDGDCRREEKGVKSVSRAEERRGEDEAAGLGARGREVRAMDQGTRLPGGWSRCRLRARPLGLKGLPELKTICTAPFLIWLSEQPTLHTHCLSLSLSFSMLNRSAIHKEG